MARIRLTRARIIDNGQGHGMKDHRIERLSAWYQPIVDLNTGKVAGCEVLSRIVAADGSAEVLLFDLP